jgi:hypothetical protein
MQHDRMLDQLKSLFPTARVSRKPNGYWIVSPKASAELISVGEDIIVKVTKTTRVPGTCLDKALQLLEEQI